MKYKICIVNGPNLNLLGKREPEIYGSKSFEDYLLEMKKRFPEVALSYFQSNHEGAIIDYLHEVGFENVGVVINPGAYAHYSYAIADAIRSIECPVVEVHISDIKKRESFRQHSVTASACIEMISAKGLAGYDEAVKILLPLQEG